VKELGHVRLCPLIFHIVPLGDTNSDLLVV